MPSRKDKCGLSQLLSSCRACTAYPSVDAFFEPFSCSCCVKVLADESQRSLPDEKIISTCLLGRKTCKNMDLHATLSKLAGFLSAQSPGIYTQQTYTASGRGSKPLMDGCSHFHLSTLNLYEIMTCSESAVRVRQIWIRPAECRNLRVWNVTQSF